MTVSTLRFPKSERLCSRRDIQMLFREGKRIFQPPLQLIWSLRDNDNLERTQEIQIMVSVPKRFFRRAHQRNRIKRQLREAWRIHRSSLFEKKEALSSTGQTKRLHIAFVYQSDQNPGWQPLCGAMENAIRTLVKKLS
jgi:ribonuclease P protein component